MIPDAGPDRELYQKLKWVMFFRVLFYTLLLGSATILQLGKTSPPLTRSLLLLYALIAVIFILSFFYSLILPRIRRLKLFAYGQIAIDTGAVTFIVFLTGSFVSLFSFLYLVVIIYASMLLYRRGSMVMAVLCSIQYGLLIDLEYYGLIQPAAMEKGLAITDFTPGEVLYKIVAMMAGCFAVAFFSGLLSEQTRRTKKELAVMESHVKRVEKMAAVGEMAAGLAHEIKNPLASLRGSIQMLKDTLASDDDTKTLMGIILREADRLNSLVGDFLMFARPPAGNRSVIDVRKTLSEIVALFDADRGEGRLAIETDIPEEIWVEMDPSHLRQILWNLLLNAAEAIEALGREDGRIRISAHSGRSRHAVLRIKDNGGGIPPDLMKTIFDPFVTTKPRGTGLGLSVVHRLVESYDSWLDVESEPGRGAAFILTLKKADDARG
jgi:two-component system, NtrC family, sensor histidine kinase HydH